MNARLWLIVSLGINVALAAYIVAGRRTPSEGVSPSQTMALPTDTTAPAGASPVPAPGKAGRVVTVTNLLEASFDWRQVESADYKKYIANLRAIGCPEETIRDIIIADVDKLFEDRRKALRAANTKKFEYWKGGMEMFAGLTDEKKIEQHQALAKERRDLLIQLLGSAPEEKLDVTAMWGGGDGLNDMMTQMLDFLTPAQQTQVIELEQKFNAKLMKAMGDSGGGEEAASEMMKVQKEKEAELAKFLTPEELEAYQLRMSQTAMMMRFQLASFEPDEQEFVEIFRATKAFQEEFGMMGRPQDKEGQAKFDAADKAMKEAMKEKLGDRYADYERAQDWQYNQLHAVAKKNGVAKEATVAVWDMRKAAQDEAGKVRNDKSLSTEQRNAALQAIADETTRSVQQTLGDDAFKAFQKNRTASGWLNELAPKPNTSK